MRFRTEMETVNIILTSKWKWTDMFRNSLMIFFVRVNVFGIIDVFKKENDEIQILEHVCWPFSSIMIRINTLVFNFNAFWRFFVSTFVVIQYMYIWSDERQTRVRVQTSPRKHKQKNAKFIFGHYSMTSFITTMLVFPSQPDEFYSQQISNIFFDKNVHQSPKPEISSFGDFDSHEILLTE